MRPLIQEQVQRVIAAVEKDGPGDFDRRAAGLELLEVHVFNRLQHLAERAPLDPALLALRAEAATLHQRLEAANHDFCEGFGSGSVPASTPRAA